MALYYNTFVLLPGIGFGICIIASYVAMYYNTIISWALYFLFSSFRREVPWASCDNEWNTPNCSNVNLFNSNRSAFVPSNYTTSPAAEFFE